MTAEIHDVKEVLAGGALDVWLLPVVVLKHVLDELIGKRRRLIAFWTSEQPPLVLPLLVLILLNAYIQALHYSLNDVNMYIYLL